MRLLLCRSLSTLRTSRSFFLACKTGSCFLFNQVFGLQSLFVSFRCFSFQLRPLVVAAGVTCVAPALHVLAWERSACCTAGASPAGGLPPLRDLKLQLFKLFGFGLGVAIADAFSGHVISSGYQTVENRISSRALAAAFAARALARATCAGRPSPLLASAAVAST